MHYPADSLTALFRLFPGRERERAVGPRKNMHDAVH